MGSKKIIVTSDMILRVFQEKQWINEKRSRGERVASFEQEFECIVHGERAPYTLEFFYEGNATIFLLKYGT